MHKAQGSEFGAVILVLPRSSNLLTREMLYTALTRQRNRVWILHQGAFSHYSKLRSEFFSETARRSTNLFGAPDMHHLSVQDIGGIRWGWLAAKLIHSTRRGDLVSSKSEILIADTLYALEQAGRSDIASRSRSPTVLAAIVSRVSPSSTSRIPGTGSIAV